MDLVQFESDLLPKLIEARELLARLSHHLGSDNAIAFMETQGLFEDALYGLQRVIRKVPKGRSLDLILESHGGSIDTAYAIASLCRARFKSFRVLVPFMAKSAATLLALAADELLVTCSTQLGPVDPQVRHPEKRGVWFPAHSIREALAEVEAARDELVKVTMADKLDPFLIGAYKDAIAASQQYVDEVAERWNLDNKPQIVSAFTDKYKSHGYPIDRRVLTHLKVPHREVDDAIEDLVCTLHELCIDLLNVESDGGMIILTDQEYLLILGSSRFKGNFPPKKAMESSESKDSSD